MEELRKVIVKRREYAEVWSKFIDNKPNPSKPKDIYKIVEDLLRRNGAIDAKGGCFCGSSKATREEVLTFYSSMFAALKSFGFSDSELRYMLLNFHYLTTRQEFEKHHAYRQEEFQHELDILDPDSWYILRGGLCGLNMDFWAAMIVKFLTPLSNTAVE